VNRAMPTPNSSGCVPAYGVGWSESELGRSPVAGSGSTALLSIDACESQVGEDPVRCAGVVCVSSFGPEHRRERARAGEHQVKATRWALTGVCRDNE